MTCVKPSGALYVFPRLDPEVYPIEDDQQFVLDLLRQEKLLVVQGTGFNWPSPDHFRIVTLPHADDLEDAIGRLGRVPHRPRVGLAPGGQPAQCRASATSHRAMSSPANTPE